jgi:hypothetical protein
MAYANPTALHEFVSDTIAELQKMNKEQLEGASFSLFTLYDSLHPDWLIEGIPLNNFALYKLFSSLANICGKLHTITRRHKSSEWIGGAIEIMEKIRHHLRSAGTREYMRTHFMKSIEDLTDAVDKLIDKC